MPPRVTVYTQQFTITDFTLDLRGSLTADVTAGWVTASQGLPLVVTSLGVTVPTLVAIITQLFIVTQPTLPAGNCLPADVTQAVYTVWCYSCCCSCSCNKTTQVINTFS